MPENEPSSSDENRTGHDREIMRSALNGMSVDQLRDLHSAIIRLKHLPFTKLVETLFTQQASGNDHAFVQNSSGHYESKATRELCEDVEMMLKARVGTTD